MDATATTPRFNLEGALRLATSLAGGGKKRRSFATLFSLSSDFRRAGSKTPEAEKGDRETLKS